MKSKLFPQNLGLIGPSRIRKFQMCASPLNANPHIFMMSPQIAIPQISTKFCTTLCQNSPQSPLFKRSLVMYNFESEHYKPHL